MNRPTPPVAELVMDLPWLVPLAYAASLWSLTPDQAQRLIWRGERLFQVVLINGQPMVTRASLLEGLGRYG